MIRTFSPLTGITKDDKFILHLFNTVKGYIELNINHYEQYDPKSIIIDYYISDLPLSDNSFDSIRQIINNDGIIEVPPVINTHGVEEILDYNFLPKHIYLPSWSNNIIFKSGVRYAHFTKSDLIFDFNIYKNHYICKVSLASNNTVILKFKDTMLSSGNTSHFQRIIYKKDDKYNFQWKEFIYAEGIVQEAYERVLDINYFKLPKRIKTIKNRIEKTKSSGNPKIPQSTIVKLV